jgi:(2Fe-2S) ferredoxin
MSHDETLNAIPTLTDKPKMRAYKRHLLICVGPRCTQNGESDALFASLGEKFKAAGIDKGELRVKRTRTQCFATCVSGPIACVQPDGIWYYNVTESNLDRIIREHLVGGRPVEDLIYHRASGCVPAG